MQFIRTILIFHEKRKVRTYAVGDTRQGEAGGKLHNVLLELSDKLGGFTVTRLVSLDKVLEKLGTSLFLSLERNLDDTVEELGNLFHILLLHRSGSQGRGTDSDTTGDEGRSVTGNGVLVEGDVSGITNLLNLGAGQTDRPEVPENQVVLSTVSLEPVTVFEQDGSHGSSVGADLLGVLLESGVGSLLEGDGDTGDGVVVGATLTSREDGSVDTSLKVRFLVLSEEDETSSGTTEGLVGSGGHDVTVLERRVLLGSSDETGDVGHVGQEVSALAIGDLSETAIVPVTGVSRTTANEKTGFEEVGVGLELGVVNDTSLGVDSVRERLEVDGRSSDLLLGGVVTVGEVTTIRETKTHHSVLGADEGSESGKAGVYMLVAEEINLRDACTTHLAVEPE